MDINKFDVVVWVRKTDSFPTLRDELLRLARNEPDESTSYEGMVDFHWGFVDLADAEHVAAALSQMASRSDIVLLRLCNYDNLVRRLRTRTRDSRGTRPRQLYQEDAGPPSL
jgi:hypothetical protein